MTNKCKIELNFIKLIHVILKYTNIFNIKINNLQFTT